MKFSQKLGLNVISMLILAACSGGGSGNSGASPTNVSLENKADQPIKAQPSNKPVQPIASQSDNKPVEDKPVQPLAPQSDKKPAEDKPVQPVAPQFDNKPIEDKPAVTEELPPKATFDNNKIFAEFNQKGGVYDTNEWISLKFDDDKVRMLPIAANIHLNNAPELSTLNDKEGRLLGYYGFAMLSKTVPNPYYPDENLAEYRYLDLLEIDDTQKVQPNKTMNYEGKFYYHYTSTPVEAKEGNAKAHYRGNDKRISLELFGENGEHWELKENARTFTVPVQSDGSVSGRLFSGKQPNGEFYGAIYGKNGEVFAGKAEYEDYNQPNNSWKGVIGTTAKEK